MAIRALTFDNAENIESRNDAYWYNFVTKSIAGTTVGIIKDGSSMEPHRDANKIIFRHGYIAIHGRLIEIDDETELTIPFADIDKTVTGKVIIRVNLQNEPGKQVFLTTTTDNVLKQEDLNTNLSGTYEFEIGSYTADHTSVRNYIDKRTYINNDYVANKISSTNDRIDSINNNYGVTQNDKWKEVDIMSEFSENAKPNNKWYLFFYRDYHVPAGYTYNFNIGKMKFDLFKWDRQDMIICNLAIWPKVGVGVILFTSIGIQHRDKKTAGGLWWAQFKGNNVNANEYGILRRPKTGSQANNEDDMILKMYRWDGSGFPMIAGGGLNT